MKMCFAEYLPVEGEIKEESWYFTDKGKLLKFTGRFCLGDKLPSAYKPAKLFLGSRDIQAGDEVMFQLVLNKTPWKKLKVLSYDNDEKSAVLEDGDYRIHTTIDNTNTCFKVIGEISPDATWVKEGDEFDEDDIKILNFGKGIKERIQILNKESEESLGTFEGAQKYVQAKILSEMYFPEELEQSPVIVQIKGPCGHFH